MATYGNRDEYGFWSAKMISNRTLQTIKIKIGIDPGLTGAIVTITGDATDLPSDAIVGKSKLLELMARVAEVERKQDRLQKMVMDV